MNARVSRLLLRTYPKAWRRRYGEEFDELLSATATTIRAVLDVVCCGLTERARCTRTAARVLVAVGCFASMDALAVRVCVTDNILWAPTTPTRALMLMITLAPLVAVAPFRGLAIRRR